MSPLGGFSSGELAAPVPPENRCKCCSLGVGTNELVGTELIKRLADERIEDEARLAWLHSREFAKRWRIHVGDEAFDGGIDDVGRRARVNTPARDGIGQPPYRIFTGPVMHGSILPRPHTTST
jgi:hypothetical protein